MTAPVPATDPGAADRHGEPSAGPRRPVAASRRPSATAAATRRGPAAGRQTIRLHLPRCRRPAAKSAAHQADRARRHPRSDGHRAAGARGRPVHQAARSPGPDRQDLPRRPSGSVSRPTPTTPTARRRSPTRRGRGDVADDDIRAGVAALTGPMLQVPSSVSAIKVDGRRAYDLVRAGETVELAARPVTVVTVRDRRQGRGLPTASSTSMSRWSAPRAPTSARWPATSVARSGVGGHLTRLRRTRVGPFLVTDAVTVVPGRLRLPTGRPGRAGDRRSSLAAIAARILPAAEAVRHGLPGPRRRRRRGHRVAVRPERATGRDRRHLRCFRRHRTADRAAGRRRRRSRDRCSAG